MPLISLPINPGVITDASEYAVGKSSPHWVMANNVRFINGFPAKRGGFEYAAETLTASDRGIPRNILAWQANNGDKIIAVGTHRKLWVFKDGVAHDITPTGLTLGDTPYYDSGTGWGAGTFNTPRANNKGIDNPADVNVLNFDPTQWSLLNFGEDLIAVLVGGDIYHWSYSGGVAKKAQSLSDLALPAGVTDRRPNAARVGIVSMPDRHIVLGGVDPLDTAQTKIDPMLVRWAHQETLTDWNPTTTNTAGDQLLEHGTEILAMTQTRRQTLIGTDWAMYVMNFTGPPYTFRIELLGTSCGVISKDAMIDVDGTAYWMGNDSFYMYSGGGMQEIPCSVKYHVFADMDPGHSRLVFAAHNSQYEEIAWHYLTSMNEGRYVVYNYREGWWSLGSSDATCWAETGGIYATPISFNESGRMRYEESGADNGDQPLSSYLESSPIELTSGGGSAVSRGGFFAEGDQLMYLSRLIPDFHEIRGGVQVTVKGRKYPSADEIAKPPFVVDGSTRKHDIKLRARQMRLIFETSNIGDAYHMGMYRAELTGDGQR